MITVAGFCLRGFDNVIKLITMLISVITYNNQQMEYLKVYNDDVITDYHRLYVMILTTGMVRLVHDH